MFEIKHPPRRSENVAMDQLPAELLLCILPAVYLVVSTQKMHEITKQRREKKEKMLDEGSLTWQCLWKRVH
jgi:hypothetical protein